MRKSILPINANSKSQSWSIDIALGVVVFMAAFFIVYSLLNSNPNEKASNLEEEASIIIKQVGSEDSQIRIIDHNEVNISKANELKNLSYNELKRRLRIESDFCIYFEDDKGYLVIINNSYKGIGAPIINLSGTPCSQK
ncbi:hypothetical protein J4234_02160 [Candidatus Woesearchaeota archaeon]|nr:hypothetical protein [Candidatus Woesearchaeota archaeon]